MLALAASGCAGNYKTTFEHAERVEPIAVHVIPVMNVESSDAEER